MAVYFDDNNKKLCCGCRGCEQICPTGSITMREDEEGFLYPIIEEVTCINCEVCKNTCPIRDGGYINKHALINPEVYGAYHKDEQILAQSTSGGAFSAIAEAFCDNDYIIFGATFDEQLVVKHTYILDKKDINMFRGSKYVQSDLQNSFKKIKLFLSEGKKVLFSGTPCQVAGLKTFLKRDYDNLLCVDILCHGVPSPKIFNLYIEYLSEKYNSKVLDINFRDKSKEGWSKPYATISFVNGKKIRTLHEDNTFMIGFYKGYYFRPICYTCHFTTIPRVSDITIADFWGVEEISPKLENNKGTSLLIINSSKGIEILNKLEQYLMLEKTKLSDVMKFNPRLYQPKEYNPMRELYFNGITAGMEFKDIIRKYHTPRPLAKRIINKILDKKTKNKIKKALGKY